MLESTDNLLQDNYSSITSNLYWQPNTANVYEECLKAFFSDGIKFNSNLLYKSTMLPNSVYNQEYIINTSFGKTIESLNIKTAFTLKIKSETDIEIKFYFSNTDYDLFSLSPDGTFSPSAEEPPVIITHYEYRIDTNEIYIEHVPTTLDENGYKIVISDVFIQKDFLILKEYIYRDNALNFFVKAIPQMDSADLCAFLWFANKGKILKNKIFSGRSLIENKFSEIDFVKQINFNEYLPEDTYQSLLKNTNSGDIYVFNQLDTYHCIFIIDPIKHYYTECSSRIEYELNYFYNGKINPYDFERRIKSLSENSNLYHVRLN